MFFQEDIHIENSIISIVPFSIEHTDSLKTIAFNESIWAYMG